MKITTPALNDKATWSLPVPKVWYPAPLHCMTKIQALAGSLDDQKETFPDPTCKLSWSAMTWPKSPCQCWSPPPCPWVKKYQRRRRKHILILTEFVLDCQPAQHYTPLYLGSRHLQILVGVYYFQTKKNWETICKTKLLGISPICIPLMCSSPDRNLTKTGWAKQKWKFSFSFHQHPLLASSGLESPLLGVHSQRKRLETFLL